MLTLRINRDEEEPIAYAHHGSLSLEIRTEVERRLKAGALKAIVATHSLELGIDIGALDEVVLVQSPFSISSAIQRVGRSGHQVNQTSRGSFFPTHPKDLLEAAVLVPAILNRDIESFKTVQSPLDVLAQVIVSMIGVETWDMDRLYAELKGELPLPEPEARRIRPGHRICSPDDMRTAGSGNLSPFFPSTEWTTP